MDHRAREHGDGQLAREPELSSRRSRCGYGVGLAAFLVVVGSSAGCVTLGSLVPGNNPPTGTACQLVATWNHEVASTLDPTHGGAMTPGLAGRLYLFGPTIDFPLAGDGAVVVDLYDESPAPAASTTPLEEWRFDKDTLKRLLRRDAIGWGYTLFLPWGTYRTDLVQVRLKVRYEPSHGLPLYADSSTITLDHGGSDMPAPANPAPRPHG